MNGVTGEGTRYKIIHFGSVSSGSVGSKPGTQCWMKASASHGHQRFHTAVERLPRDCFCNDDRLEDIGPNGLTQWNM